MTDTSSMNKTIADQIAEILALEAEEEAKKAAAVKAEDDRNDALIAAKARCTAECGEVQEALAKEKNPNVRRALIELESRTHASHAGDLEAAYLAFAGQREGESNPARPGTTNIDTHVRVDSEASP